MDYEDFLHQKLSSFYCFWSNKNVIKYYILWAYRPFVHLPFWYGHIQFRNGYLLLSFETNRYEIPNQVIYRRRTFLCMTDRRTDVVGTLWACFAQKTRIMSIMKESDYSTAHTSSNFLWDHVGALTVLPTEFS